MKGLLINEWVKIAKQKSTLVMLILLVVGVFGLAGLTVAMNKQTGTDSVSSENWKVQAEEEIQNKKSELEMEDNKFLESMLEGEIAIAEYRLKNDIPPLVEYNVWSFLEDSRALVSFVGLFMIIIAASVVANEFSFGTIKLLLIRPANRVQILVSKYVTVLFYGLTFLVSLFVVSMVTGLVVFGAPSESTPFLAYAGNEVVEKSWTVHMFTQYLLAMVDIFIVATMAFAVSSLFRNQSLAIGLSLFLLFVGSTATGVLALFFDWAKFLLFANTDLTVYFNGGPIIDGMTLGFSITILVLHWLFFQIVAFLAFVKRDVAG